MTIVRLIFSPIEKSLISIEKYHFSYLLLGDDLYKHRVSFDQIHDGLVLPSEVCDHLLQTMISEGLDVDDRVAKAFGDPFKTRLRRLELRNSNLTNHGFHQLAKHKFRELRLFNCLHLTEDVLLDLNDYSDNLVELTIDPAAGVFPAYFPGTYIVQYTVVQVLHTYIEPIIY